MSEYARFNQRMFKIAKNVDVNSNKLVKEAAVAAATALVDKTPVDSGKAISNWQAGLNYAPVSIRQPFYPGKKGSTAAGNRRSAKAAMKVVINGRKTGQTIYLVNNVPYMDRLNSGYSAQAPAGFVEAAVEAGNEVIRSVALLKD